MDVVNQPTESITKLEEINNRITMAESEYRRLQGLISSNKQEIDQLVKDKKFLDEEVSDAKNELAVAKNDLKKSVSENEKAKKVLSELKAENDELKNSIEEREKQNAQLETKLDSRIKEAEEKEQKAKVSTQEATDTLRELDEAQARLDEQKSIYERITIFAQEVSELSKELKITESK